MPWTGRHFKLPKWVKLCRDAAQCIVRTHTLLSVYWPCAAEGSQGGAGGNDHAGPDDIPSCSTSGSSFMQVHAVLNDRALVRGRERAKLKDQKSIRIKDAGIAIRNS